MLTFAILLPLIGSLVLAFAPRLDVSVARASAVGTSVLPLAALVMVSLDFDASGAQFQAVAETEWIPALGVAWRVGVDGIALALALMTALLFLAAVAWPAETQGRARQYYAWFLFLEGASLGVFLPLDLLVFRSEEHTSELQSLMRTSYAAFCLKKKKSISTNSLNKTPTTLKRYIQYQTTKECNTLQNTLSRNTHTSVHYRAQV